MAREQEFKEYLHTIPELGFQEKQTAAFVANILREAGYEVTEGLGGKTGVVGVIDSGVPGPVVAVRADMDALGHIVDGEHVAIHSCGHDGHTSMALAAAEVIAQEGRVKKGKLKMIFQPAEEIGQGAYSIIDSGVLDDVEYFFGQHVRPIQEAKLGQGIAALYYSASTTWEVEIHGQRAHGARPHLGHNALSAAAVMILAAGQIQCNPEKSYSAKATRCLCDAGVTNAIPDLARVAFDMRAGDNETMAELKERMKTAIEGAVQSCGCTCEIKTLIDLPAAVYDEGMCRLLEESIREVLGEENTLPAQTTPGGEDFCCYVVAKPHLKVGFYGLGADLTPGLHQPDMTFDPKALTYGKNIILTAVGKLLG
ncbi:MAG: amidohydrolase [Veillonellaceae bacterium]|nr:amidohydrolase [Veillonellaceae bacterium]